MQGSDLPIYERSQNSYLLASNALRTYKPLMPFLDTHKNSIYTADFRKRETEPTLAMENPLLH